MHINLFQHEGKTLTDTDFEQCFQTLGINEGDTVWVHSDLMAFGSVASNTKPKMLLNALLQTLKRSIGDDGTLIMPTFTYSFTRNEVFDVQKSPSKVGDLTEFFRRSQGVERSHHPLFSVASWGKHQTQFLDTNANAFDTNRSAFAALRHQKGKILMLGAKFFDHCTFFHHLEFAADVPYRYLKDFGGMVKNDDDLQATTASYYVRNLEINPYIDGSRLKKHLIEQKMFNQIQLGNATVELIGAEDLFREGMVKLKENPYFLVR